MLLYAGGSKPLLKSDQSAAVRPAGSVRGNDGAHLWGISRLTKRGRVDNEKNENTGIGSSEDTKRTLQERKFSV